MEDVNIFHHKRNCLHLHKHKLAWFLSHVFPRNWTWGSAKTSSKCKMGAQPTISPSSFSSHHNFSCWEVISFKVGVTTFNIWKCRACRDSKQPSQSCTSLNRISMLIYRGCQASEKQACIWNPQPNIVVVPSSLWCCCTCFALKTPASRFTTRAFMVLKRSSSIKSILPATLQKRSNWSLLEAVRMK